MPARKRTEATPSQLYATRGAGRHYGEHEEQAALIQWARYMRGQIPELRLLHSVPNGGARPQRTDRRGRTYSPEAVRLAEEGLEPGIPDLHLPVGRGEYYSLYIEMKYGKNKTSPEQDEIIELLRAEGNKVVVCYSWLDGRQAIMDYLGLDIADYES